MCTRTAASRLQRGDIFACYTLMRCCAVDVKTSVILVYERSHKLTFDDVVDGDVMTGSDACKHDVNVVTQVDAGVPHPVPD